MLRSLVLVLLIVNLGFLGWSQGWLGNWMGAQTKSSGESHRMTDPLNADQIEIAQASKPKPTQETASQAATPASAPPSTASTPEAASAATSDATVVGVCLEAGPFKAGDATNIDKQLRAALQANSWVKQSIPISGLWMVYMGPYPNEAVFERRFNELKRVKGLTFDEVRGGTYAKGFSLGRFTSEADAQARMISLRQKGLRTSRVITIRPDGQVHYLRVAQATQAMQVTLSSLRLPLGKSFIACRS